MAIEEMLNTLIGTVVGAGIALIFSYFLYNRENKEKIERSATVLWQDIDKSLKTLDIAQRLLNNDEQGVLKTQFSGLANSDSYVELVVDLRDKVQSGHIKKIITYYGNLAQLQSAQKEFWTKENECKGNYVSIFNSLFGQVSNQEFQSAFAEVKKLSVFKGEN